MHTNSPSQIVVIYSEKKIAVVGYAFNNQPAFSFSFFTFNCKSFDDIMTMTSRTHDAKAQAQRCALSALFYVMRIEDQSYLT